MRFNTWKNIVEYDILNWDNFPLYEIDIDFIENQINEWYIEWEFEVYKIIDNEITDTIFNCYWKKIA